MRMSQHRHEMLMQKVGIQTKAINDARQYNEPGFQFTRRVIALTAIFAIILVPILAGVFDPYVPISYGFTETKGGFMFFTDPKEMLTWATGTGLVLGPIHTHLLYAIAGMYFGSSSVK
jgi:hypothetical protein